jgi:hypothetical protein
MANSPKIQGWLIVFALILPVQLIIHFNYFLRGISILVNKDFLQLQLNYSQQYVALVKYSAILMILSSFVLIICMSIVNYLFFTRKKSFINLFIIVNSLSVVMSFISEYLGGVISFNQPLYLTSIRLMIFLFVSILYFQRSNRVKSTFIH